MFKIVLNPNRLCIPIGDIVKCSRAKNVKMLNDMFVFSKIENFQTTDEVWHSIFLSPLLRPTPLSARFNELTRIVFVMLKRRGIRFGRTI